MIGPRRVAALLVALTSWGCGRAQAPPTPTPSSPALTAHVHQTSKAGDALADKGRHALAPSAATDAPTVRVDPSTERQEIVGFGGAFTESAAYVLGQLEPAQRRDVIARTFGRDGAHYSLTRTHIGSCDFGPVGKYGYASKPDLSDFTVAEDEPDLIPLIKDAQRAPGASFKIIASPWSAPPFMKAGGKAGGWFGGRLQDAHYGTFAKYIARYVEAYRAKGIDIWAITPENEPLGNGQQWESMHFTPSEMARLIRDNLGPAMSALGVKILAFDQNRDHVESWAAALLGDPAVKRHVYGTAVHWYSSTFKVYEDVLDRVHAAHPDRVILNSEATADVIWDDPAEWEPPPPIGKQHDYRPATMHYWKNWGWWWEVRGTDWGFRWASDANKPDHPRHAVANRFIRDIIGGLNHWFVGWVEWNLVLDERGGPNHVGNFCGAPVMIDTTAKEVFYTPVYYVLSHFSRYLRPGARVLDTTAPEGLIATAARNPDGSIAVVVANIAPHPERYAEVVDRAFRLQLGGQAVDLRIPAHAVQTLVVTSAP